MNKLSSDIQHLLQKIEILDDYEVERLVIEHLQKHLNALDELQQSYHRHYLGIIETLLKQLTQITSEQQEIVRQRLLFLEKLLHKPSLTDLETLHRGICDFDRGDESSGLLSPNDKIIGDPLPSSEQSFAAIPVSDQISAIESNNDRFAQILHNVLQQIEQLANGAQTAEARRYLQDQARLLLHKQRYLSEQLKQARRRLLDMEDKLKRLDRELQTARTLSLTDELTGLPNRRAFLQRLEEEMGRVRRHPTPLSLAIIDIDRFKKINDDFGHAAGDRVLQAYAKKILGSFRGHDQLARFGGEEFILLLPHTDTCGAVMALTKIRQQISRCQFKVDRQEIPLPTFSAGVAGYRENESPQAFMERADQALYRAKKGGRNKIESAD